MKRAIRISAIFAVMLLTSCVSRDVMTIERTQTDDNVRVVKQVTGSAELRGGGKLSNQQKRDLGQEARKDMVKSHPAGANQTYANVEVEFKSTNYLFSRVHKATLNGQLVEAKKGSTTPPATTTPPDPTPTTTPTPTPTPPASGERPAFIVNARLGITDWSKITPWNEAITALRIPGGSASQYTWGDRGHVPKWLLDDPKKERQQIIITNQMIKAYEKFESERNLETYFCLNINDDLQNQLALLDRFFAEGVNIKYIELGNETYLPKFRTGKKSALGFVRIITIDDYVKIMSEWLPALRKYDAQLLVVLASRSMDGGNADNYRRDWNNAVVKQTEKMSKMVDGYVVHVYGGKGDAKNEDEEDLSTGDYSYMDAFKLPIHITESGYQDANWSAEGLQKFKDFHRGLYEYVTSRNDGSRHGTHVLYNTRRVDNHPYILYDPNGITPIGQAAMEFPFEKR